MALALNNLKRVDMPLNKETKPNHLSCVDTRCSLEDLPEAADDKNGWQKWESRNSMMSVWLNDDEDDDVYTHTYTHTHIRFHPYMHICIYTHTHLYICIHSYKYIYTHTHMHTHTYIHTHHRNILLLIWYIGCFNIHGAHVTALLFLLT